LHIEYEMIAHTEYFNCIQVIIQIICSIKLSMVKVIFIVHVTRYDS
jgi:hypothetical protein